MNATAFVAHVARVPGVEAVTLGGSRARGVERPDSDWDFGLYYREGIDTDAIRALGYAGHVAEPGAWGRIVNGGAGHTHARRDHCTAGSGPARGPARTGNRV